LKQNTLGIYPHDFFLLLSKVSRPNALTGEILPFTGGYSGKLSSWNSTFPQ
jgi:hypothetical protein